MQVIRHTEIKLNSDEIAGIICEHLSKDKGLKVNKKDVHFNVSKHREDEDLFSPGYEVLRFDGCTLSIKEDQK